MARSASEKNKSIESWIWDAACSFRGAKDAPKMRLVPVPVIEEQEDIARALALFDDKTNNALSKKTCLQDLFRTLLHELMTAKTRVHELEINA